MKKGISIICSLAMVLQLILGAVPVFADESGIGEAYKAPESPAITYNMNLDWKFFDCGAAGADLKKDIWEVMAKADKDGKKFYEKDYDDSAWTTVSIPHGIGGGTNSFTGANYDAGGGYRSVLLYRKTITIPNYQPGSKVFFELEGIRQGAYVWVNGQQVGYYEAGISAMGFDITKYIESQSSSASAGRAVIALLDDGLTSRGTYDRIPYETVPGQKWGSSYSTDNYKTTVGTGSGYQWNTKDFNEPQIGLVYDAYLHVKGKVYQTLPLYNNLKTTGNYIYADNFSIRDKEATIHVDAEVRNESGTAGEYTLEVAVVGDDGKLKYKFESNKTSVAAAEDAGKVYETAVEANAYSEAGLANAVGITDVNTPDVTHITASYAASDVEFWSPDYPYLYTVYTILKDASGNVVDVQKKDTGFRKITFDDSNGILINDQPCWMPGYAQRSTNEWAVIGVATDWLQDYDMALLKENNSNFIRWMHVAPKPNEVRSSDRYGVAVVVPAGDKEGSVDGRQWSQRVEAMRDVMIYFRNSPSVVFWETGNTAVGSAAKANEMAAMRDKVDPHGMRFIGARSTQSADQLNYEYNYAGTMYGNYASNAQNGMKANGKPGPIMETEYARNEAPRRVWDRYSPPDYDYVNKFLSGSGAKKEDGFDVWNETSEDNAVNVIKEYNGYYTNRGKVYSAAAMMIWSDSNMHTRNTATENCRTSGRVDPVRQTKESFYSTKTAQSSKPAVHIVGHWSYPEVSEDTYNYFGVTKGSTGTQEYEIYNINNKLKRDPTKKKVYVIGSADIRKVELYRVDEGQETLIGTDDSADNTFIYQFDNIDVTKGDAVIAKAYNARGEVAATDEIKRTGDKAAIKITPHTAVKENADGSVESDWRADGADIAYFDIEIVDKDGNVCALNYDRINLSWTGEGEFLGGYNSGSGANCFQNMSGSAGLSNYFGGDKNGISTIGKNYVYAENGTNRIFVRSTRNAGMFTLTASMEGIPGVSSSVQSTAVETTGGLTTQMTSVLSPGAKEPPKLTNTPALKPLMFAKKLIDWSKVETVVEVDTTDYYDTYLNGTKLNLTARSRMGAMNTLFGPITEIMDALTAAGVTSFSYTKTGTTVSVTLPKDLERYIGDIQITAGSYNFTEGVNQLYKEGLVDPITETVEAATVENGVMISNLPLLFDLIDGVSFAADNDKKEIYITTTAGGAE